MLCGELVRSLWEVSWRGHRRREQQEGRWGVQLQMRRSFEVQGKRAAVLQIGLKAAVSTAWDAKEKRQEDEIPAS
jgi:hypothetical protein